jgi:hypothetical protein
VPLSGDICVSSKGKKVLTWSAVAICLALLTWRIVEPRVYVWLIGLNVKGEKGEAHGRWVAERLASCGPRAIPAILNAIRHGSPFTRGNAYLPLALAQIGEPAHQALKEAILAETEPKVRSYLIGALLSGFQDMAFMQEWLDDYFGGKLSIWHAVHIQGELRRLLEPPMPLVTENGEPNREFLTWWNARRATQRGQ